MAKRVIILDRSEGAPPSFSCVFWLTVPTGRENYYKRPLGTKSAWKDASQAELDAIVAGQVVEVVDTVSYLASTGIPAIEADLESRWAARQSNLDSTQVPQRYGSSWDGAAWTLVNI